MRALIALGCLLLISGCVKKPVAHRSASELDRLVGQNVTLSGEFSLNGVIDPYIMYNGKPVYLEAHPPFTWGPDYERLQGKVASISGVLHFRHYEPSDEQHPPDYFYFEVETSKVELK